MCDNCVVGESVEDQEEPARNSMEAAILPAAARTPAPGVQEDSDEDKQVLNPADFMEHEETILQSPEVVPQCETCQEAGHYSYDCPHRLEAMAASASSFPTSVDECLGRRATKHRMCEAPASSKRLSGSPRG